MPPAMEGVGTLNDAVTCASVCPTPLGQKLFVLCMWFLYNTNMKCDMRNMGC